MLRSVLILINSRSGLSRPGSHLFDVLKRQWTDAGCTVELDTSESIEDGRRKAERAVREGKDAVIVVGGDGMVNSIGSVLVGTETALGVIPAGSGNGFARHFDIPLKPERAVQALIHARKQRIDVGRANEKPFFVTCSMAWDAAIVRTFEKSPVRGILPYVFAAVYEFFEYKRQPFTLIVDEEEELHFKSPLVCTVANLTQYGGGARIAPQASPDDGFLELVVISATDAPKVLAQLHRLFTGSFDSLNEVVTRRFRRMTVKRAQSAPIQIDGELVEADRDVVVDVQTKSMSVLVPDAQA